MWSTSASAMGSSDGEALSASAIVAETITGSHVLKIQGYSLIKGLGNGKYIKSSTFSVGGHRWYIRYYPDGDGLDNADWISIYLQHDDTEVAQVKALFGFRVIGEMGDPVSSFIKKGQLHIYSGKNRCWGYNKFVQRKALEESTCVKDDILRIRCDITITKEIRTEAAMKFVTVPPSNMHHQLGRFLLGGEGVDVTFEVAGEMFPAHRCVLAARSSVFKAEVYGPLKEKGLNRIRIDDMDARVFKAMLHFIYTDTMPDLDKEDALVLTQHLLVAAGRYDLERLKLICEDKLCDRFDGSTVASTLALAEQHGCHGLKMACFEFLKSPSNLKAAIASEGFDHLMRSCPSVIKEMLAKVSHCP